MPLPALERFGNDAATTTTADPGSGGTTLAVTSGAAPLPQAAQFRVRVEDEIMIVTAGAGTNSWTVTRGAEGTAAVAHASGSTVTHIMTAGALDNYSPRVALQQRMVMPAAALAEANGGRMSLGTADTFLTSGRLRLGALTVLPANETVASITICSGSTDAASPTNQWFALVRASDRSVLRKTADDTTTAWPAGTLKTLTLSTTYTPTEDELVYLAVMVAAGTTPSLVSWQMNVAALFAASPAASGHSTSGLTTPASLGATAAAPTSTGTAHYGYVS